MAANAKDTRGRIALSGVRWPAVLADQRLALTGHSE